MAINQLFLKEPKKEILLEILHELGFKSFEDKKSFSQFSINNVYDRIIPLIYKLKEYYIPCKSNIYFNNLNSKKIITIIKQCLKIYELRLLSKEVYFKEKKHKYLYYYIENIKNVTNDKQKPKHNIRYDNIILTFD